MDSLLGKPRPGLEPDKPPVGLYLFFFHQHDDSPDNRRWGRSSGWKLKIGVDDMERTGMEVFLNLGLSLVVLGAFHCLLSLLFSVPARVDRFSPAR